MRPGEVCLTPLSPHQVLCPSLASKKNPCQAPLASLIPIPAPHSPCLAVPPTPSSSMAPVDLLSLESLPGSPSSPLSLWALWLITLEPH